MMRYFKLAVISLLVSMFPGIVLTTFAYEMICKHSGFFGGSLTGLLLSFGALGFAVYLGWVIGGRLLDLIWAKVIAEEEMADEPEHP